ncbi:Rv1733c family protein [Streptomyces minutiscleroticus]|uniref:Rv1733c family protein n=1 Tax=Streptomyces minutiscleroticus TaxID=68238 RepID=UPI00332FB53C
MFVVRDPRSGSARRDTRPSGGRTAPDGSSHTGLAKAEPGTRTGTPVTVWSDRANRLVSRPPTGTQARRGTSLSGTLAGTGAAGGVPVCGHPVRGRLDRYRLAEWDREWARVGPTRRRTTG